MLAFHRLFDVAPMYAQYPRHTESQPRHGHRRPQYPELEIKTINQANYPEFLLSEKTPAMEHILPAT